MITDRRIFIALPEAFIKHLSELLGNTRLLTDPAECRTYGYDNSCLQGQPIGVALPETHEEVAAIVCACREYRVSLIPRGQGTGTTGATVPGDDHTLVVSLQRMNRIVDISPENRWIIVEPGVTNQAVQTAVAEHGFFWPPDPTSAAICTVGGNLAYNSAGPRAVKYGTPRENTLALRTVTGRGETLYTGVKTTKGVVGYDLTRLLIGSEGTLAIITQATLKLTPLQPAKRTLRAFYRDVHSAARAVSAIMAQPVVPCALEFMDANAIQMVRTEVGDSLPEGAGALLMIEVDGIESQLDELAGCVVSAASVEGTLGVEAARSAEDVAALWSIRKALSPALRRVAPKKINEDVVVPVSRMPELISELEQLAVRHRTRIVNFGHAGNGNLHVNLMYDPSDNDQQGRALACLEDVFAAVLRMDGTISGEHGVGLVKRDWVGKELDDTSLRLMRSIKAQFDPDGILNPGKVLPLA